MHIKILLKNYKFLSILLLKLKYKYLKLFLLKIKYLFKYNILYYI